VPEKPLTAHAFPWLEVRSGIGCPGHRASSAIARAPSTPSRRGLSVVDATLADLRRNAASVVCGYG